MYQPLGKIYHPIRVGFQSGFGGVLNFRGKETLRYAIYYDLCRLSPRIAGTMHWNGNDRVGAVEFSTAAI